jgi:hypothetical protein
MKKKKFAEGGSSFIDDFEATKKNKAEVVADKVADKVAPVAVPAKSDFQTAEGDHPMIDANTRGNALYKKAPRSIHKSNSKSITPDALVRKDILNEFPNSNTNALRSTSDYDDAGYKSGGKVKSASSRADGCAIRGKTRA